MPRTRLKTFQFALVISLLIHLGFWLGLAVAPQTSFRDNSSVEVEILDPEKQKQLAERTQDIKQKQIVEQDQKSINEEAPDKSRYLSRFDQKVAKETKAANTGDFTNAAQPGARVVGQKQVVEKPDSAKKKSRNNGEMPSLKDLTPQFSATPKAERETASEQQGLASQTNDYLPDVESGLQTMLNTREFVYFAYYQRIREKIRMFWEPKIREKVHRIMASGRAIASTSTRITKVVIVLNSSGSLVKVQVIGESGIYDLDQAAVEAFKAAEPFPNPPDGIVEADGMIRIRWDFVLEANSNWHPVQERKDYSS